MSDNPYKFNIKGVEFDFYDLSDSIGFEQSAVEHACKKLVALGKRSGNKSYQQDLHEAIMSLMRAQEQHNESLRRGEGSPREVEESIKNALRAEPRLTIRAPATPSEVHPTLRRTSLDPQSIEDAVKFLWQLNYPRGVDVSGP